jgi:hypothetical protein
MSYRYVGAGAFHPGIPARDLSDADVKKLGTAERALIEASAIYRRVTAGEQPAPIVGGEPEGKV